MKRTASGISFEQGQILLIAFLFSGLSKMKRRPVLVFSNKIHNDASVILYVVALRQILTIRNIPFFLRGDVLDEGPQDVTNKV